MLRIYCGVPIDNCTGQGVTLNAAWTPDGNKNKKSGKLHADRPQAFKCYCRYLESQGYKRVGAREFTLGDHSPVLMIDKKSKFGAEFRLGKASEKTKTRFTPRNGRGAVCEKIK